MKRRTYPFFAMVISCFSLNVSAQMTVSTAPTGAALIASLIDPATVTVSNVVENCPAAARGSFAATGTTATRLGITNGIVITNGSAANVPKSESTFSSVSLCTNPIIGAATCPTDADLKALDASGSVQNDVCKIEFDISSPGDSLTITYVFGSEEYYDFAPPNGTYNDVFGFFISGPGITGTKNFALLPGTTTPVSIATINPSNNPGLLYNNTGNTTIVYTAFSKVLTAKAKITPGQTYHIKFGVEDASDHAYDTGIFIKANSFKATVLPVDLVYFTAKRDNTLKTKNLLKWKTAQEINNDYFLVLKRTDNSEFQPIAQIKGNGSSNIAHEYEFSDDQAGNGNNYYMLRQIDFNGQSKTSQIISVDNTAAVTVKSIVPNPVGIRFTAIVELPVDAPSARAEILDVTGRIIFSQPLSLTAGGNDVTVDTENLHSGTYFFRVVNGSEISALERIIK